MKSPVQLFIAAAILLATATVAAQVYKWVDKDGKVQYSDMPPPATATKTEARKIETSPAVVSTPALAKSLQDRAKDFDKRKTDVAEKAKKSEIDQQKAETDAANCLGMLVCIGFESIHFADLRFGHQIPYSDEFR